MPESPATPAFPTDESLCEQCGYPIKGLSGDAFCPECGMPIAESSPSKRTLAFTGRRLTFRRYATMLRLFLFKPKRSFRSLSLNTDGYLAEKFLFRNSFLAGVIIGAIVFLGTAFVIPPRFHTIPLVSAFFLFLATAIAISLLTYIEIIGVTAFSRRRGWRVPFSLAQRVCCLASVGWLPGAVVVGVGVWMIQAFGVGRPWYDYLFGLVRVGWLLYGGLFVLSFLWFETLVWIGVRQVRFANAWSDPAPMPAPEAPE